MSLGPTELIVVLVIVLVLFGGAKLPKLARSLGQAKNEFESGQKEGENVSSPSATTSSTNTSSDTVTMSKAELEALIAEKARQQNQPPS